MSCKCGLLQSEIEGAGQQQAPQADFLAVLGLTLGFLCLIMMICAANCGPRRLRIPVFHTLEGMKNDIFFIPSRV